VKHAWISGSARRWTAASSSASPPSTACGLVAALPGVEGVFHCAAVAQTYELPADRIGDLIVLADATTSAESGMRIGGAMVDRPTRVLGSLGYLQTEGMGGWLLSQRHATAPRSVRGRLRCRLAHRTRRPTHRG
jgi:hypothetical protein